MSRAERRRQWVITVAAVLPSLLLLPLRLLHLLGPLTDQAFHDAARVVFGAFVLALMCAIIWGWRTGASNARRALTGAGGIGR